MHKKFDHTDIEKKWQEEWHERGLYAVGLRDEVKDKEYVLVEWPYPSGNLHTGHWYAFAVPDIYVRFKRMSGVQTLFPMGFDAFGLPAENAAIKHNKDPKAWTDENIAFMKKQLRSMGASFSWDYTTSSTDEEYYKWTQWMFTQFFEHDIAYRGVSVVNWCPSCNTVIANEQVNDGVCERCKTEIEKRKMPQWMLRITSFADALLEDLDALDWPESIKEAQRQWIGKSAGAKLTFTLSTGDNLEVFTTRPDTLFGATYMVIAPEHSLIEKSKGKIQNWDEVSTYIKNASKKAEQDRTDASKEKTGVRIEGITATNPANGEEIPVFVADYVLASYGTGAIMAVPAHDDRDLEFAIKFQIKIKPVIARTGTMPDADTVPALTESLVQSCIDSRTAIVGSGFLINSNEFDGMDSEEAKEAITKSVGGEMTNTYRLRDWSIGRQRYWGVPIPIVYDPEGTPHLVPKEHLPWTLPTDVDFTPTGEPPLAKSKELKKRTEEIFGEGWTPEVETMDTFVDSSWYFLRYIDNKNNEEFCSKEAERDWMQVDLYFGGAEHTTMHLLYSRFWQKALHSLGLVSYEEPYVRRINRSLVLGPDGQKMSKSKGNVIDPDKEVEKFGADTVRMYLAFLGPYAEVSNYPWDTGGIAGQRRFLERVNGLHDHIKEHEPEETTRLLHKTIKKVTNDIQDFKFNTAISALMVFVNATEKSGLTKHSYATFLTVLAPFAPHIAEDLWNKNVKQSSIHTEPFPVYKEELVHDSEVTIGVQINGKLRGSITIAKDETEEKAIATAKNDEAIKKHLIADIRKVIYVPGKILNIIVS